MGHGPAKALNPAALLVGEDCGAMAQAIQRQGMFIGGSWVEASTGRTFKTLNPATGEVLAEVAEGGPDDAARAVEVARRAFEDRAWRTMDPSKRGNLIHRLGGLLREHLEEFARLETMDVGKPLKESRADIAYAAWTLEYFSGLTDKIEGRTIPVPGDRLNYTRVEPLGVTAHIVPWNYPLVLAIRSVAPALAAGNTVVVKPSSLAPLTNLRMAQLALEAALPKGVYNVVTGPGATVGKALAGHRDVDSVTFTGSGPTGKEIMRAAADHVTPVTLELGGKCPNVVLPDADHEKALRGVMKGAFTNAGQMCWAGSRLLVHEDIHRDFTRQLAEMAGRIKVGSGLDEATEMGPLVSSDQVATTKEYVESGVEEGAKLLVGGEATGGGHGYFFRPTIFGAVAPDMRIAQEEIFGPVLSVLTFRDLEDAVRIANGTAYGLCAGLWTKRLDLAHRLAAQMEAGMVAINEYPVTFPMAPFGGFNESGLGSEQGVRAVHNYTRIKNITINLR